MEAINWSQVLVSVILALISSTGLWSFIAKRLDGHDAKSRMILGLGHDRIVTLGMKYIERGWITQDEYEDLDKYLYQPYKDMGGNGSAKRVMDAVSALPIKGREHLTKEVTA